MSEPPAKPRSTGRALGSCLLATVKVVVALLALQGAAMFLGPCGLASEFSLNSSNDFVVAFREVGKPVSELHSQHATGSWTRESLSDRLGEIGFDFDGEWNYLWSCVVVFEPYTDSSDFYAAGIVDPAVASGLALAAQRDGGLHLVAFDRWHPRTITAHFYIHLEDFDGRVLVIRPEDVRPPAKWRR